MLRQFPTALVMKLKICGFVRRSSGIAHWFGNTRPVFAITRIYPCLINTRNFITSDTCRGNFYSSILLFYIYIYIIFLYIYIIKLCDIIETFTRVNNTNIFITPLRGIESYFLLFLKRENSFDRLRNCFSSM